MSRQIKLTDCFNFPKKVKEPIDSARELFEVNDNITHQIIEDKSLNSVHNVQEIESYVESAVHVQSISSSSSSTSNDTVYRSLSETDNEIIQIPKDAETGPPSKIKRMEMKVKRHSAAGNSKFRTEYSKEFSTITSSKKGESFCYCTVCDIHLVLGKMGPSAIRKHVNGGKHQELVKAKSKAAPMELFVSTKIRISEDVLFRTTIAEATWAYHTVKHHQSFKSIDCVSKTLPSLFPDSLIANEFKMGRQKATAIVKKVLHPIFHKQFIEEVQSRPFSISTDSSNHKEVKVFPIVMRYCVDGQIQNKLLALRNLPGETSEMMTEMLVNVLHENNLDIGKFIAFCADNTNANFGGDARKGTNNIFARLKLLKTDLIGIGCFAHIIHNSASSAADQLTIDFEQFALKICSYFRGQTCRHASLKEFCLFVEVEYATFTQHTVTRWLSLLPLIDRLLQLWPALKSYFASIERPPKAIAATLEDNRTEIVGHFLQSSLTIFNGANLKLQVSDITLPDLWIVICQIRKQLLSRFNQKHFGMKATALLAQFREEDSNKARSLEKEFLEFYQLSITYLDKWSAAFHADFNGNILEWLLCMVEKEDDSPIKFDVVLTCCQRFCPELSVKEELFDQVVELNETIANLVRKDSDFFIRLTTCEKWKVILKNKNISLIAQIVDTVFSIPCSNAFCERVFSMMNVQWTDERNRLDLSTVSAILGVCINSNNLECSMIANFLTQQKNIESLLQSSKKYT